MFKYVPLDPTFDLVRDIEMHEANFIIVHNSDFTRKWLKWYKIFGAIKICRKRTYRTFDSWECSGRKTRLFLCPKWSVFSSWANIWQVFVAGPKFSKICFLPYRKEAFLDFGCAETESGVSFWFCNENVQFSILRSKTVKKWHFFIEIFSEFWKIRERSIFEHIPIAVNFPIKKSEHNI